ncbi:MAG TPA: hypothetical protein VFV68_06735 [Agriterribacter sp.]|nr:hypothetical protein [Agriterribacter sp.]
MKKWSIGIIIFFLAFIGSVYLLIPNKITITADATVKATRQAVYRMLLNDESLSKWWPGTVSTDSAKKQFLLNEYSYTISDNNLTLLPITIKKKQIELHTSLYLIAPQTERVQLHWSGELPTSYNVIQRYIRFRKAKQVKRDMNSILQKMSAFFSKPENLYGYTIHHLKIVDSTYISTYDTSLTYPSTAYIYNRINKLKDYAARHSARETGYPILNIDAEDSLHYIIRVALPLDKPLPSASDIYPKRMPVNVNILMMEVRGGTETNSAAFEQLLHYVSDHHQTIPGIPFYSLVTNRSGEPDTSKWITRIYCPVR